MNKSKTTQNNENNPHSLDPIKIDATNQSMGRLASRVAKILIGKNKPSYQPNRLAPDADKVVVYNIKDLKFTGKKLENRIYYRHSQYLGNLKSRTLQEKLDRDPIKTVKDAITKMLPSNKLRKKYLANLDIYIEGVPN